MFKEFNFSTTKQFELINITTEIEDFVSQAKVKNGVILVFVPHATAGLIMNEDEAGVKEDILKKILALAPEKENYQHDRIDNNARAHVISSIIGTSLILPVIEGKMIRGTWQEIFFVELDGPRSHRRMVMKIIEDS